LERRLQAGFNRPTSVPDLTNACGWMEASPCINVQTSSIELRRVESAIAAIGGTNSLLMLKILEWDVRRAGVHILLVM
jgi:hypothetical protein